MKKYAVTLCVLAAVLALISCQALAEDQQIDAEPGEKIAVELVLTANPDKAINADIILEYDHSVFELVPTGKIINDKPDLGWVYSGLPENTTVRPEFTIKQDAPYGQYTISIRVTQAINIQEAEVTSMVFSSCIVNVCEKKPEQTQDYPKAKKTAQVRVHYVDETGKAVAADVAHIFEEGQHIVFAMQIENYQLLDNDRVDVFVDADGANPSEVAFHYRRIKRTATVIIHYTDEAGRAIAADVGHVFEEGQHTVYAIDVGDYLLLDENHLDVIVDADGAHPSEVTFHYASRTTPTPKPTPTPIPTPDPTPDPTPVRNQNAAVTIYYKDESGKILAQEQRELSSSTTLSPSSNIVDSSYVLTSEKAVSVTVKNGVATPSSVTFVYAKKNTTDPAAEKKAKTEPFRKIGNYVTFGTYPQTKSGTDNTPIEWLVLDYNANSNKALLLSRYGLDEMPFNNTASDTVTWENCSLRNWLNRNFLSKAFSAKEQSAILTTRVVKSTGQDENVSKGKSKIANYTEDKVFLLSYDEARKYLNLTASNSNNTKARVAPTAYAIKQGAWSGNASKTGEGKDAGWWWLRTTYDYYKNKVLCHDVMRVRSGGNRDYWAINQSGGCVRPAIWVDLGSDFF